VTTHEFLPHKKFSTLIRVDVNAGHGAGKSTKLQIAEWADVWSFCYANMGVTPEVKL